MDRIKRLALENALKYGKADVDKVLGKVLAESPELKNDINKLKQKIKVIVHEVNALSNENKENLLRRLNPKFFEKKESIEKEIKELKNVHKEMVLRFEPSPSGPLHLGHAYVLCLNYAYAKRYNARLILRIADTNASNIYPQAYDLIPRDAKWLTNDFIKDDDIIVQSDRLDLYYEYALKFLEKGIVYICTCPAESFRELVAKKEECSCRKNSIDTNIKKWHKMFSGYNEGDVVMRMKSDISHKNPALRDFPLFRINDDEHPRHGKKYRVWPLMNFAVSVDDHDTCVTHIIRAKDHADNAIRQKMIFEAFGWDIPETEFVGKINFKGMNLSTTETRTKIDDGMYEGWDDIRLAFLPALRRRGYKPDAFLNYALSIGITLNDKTTSKEELFKQLDSFNKQLIEKTSYRYFFIPEPYKIHITNAPEINVELDLHPDERKGGRKFNCAGDFYVCEELSDGLYRLMDCLNFVYENGKAKFHSLKYADVKDKKATIINWLPSTEHLVDVEVKMPDNAIIKGKGEHLLQDLEEGAIVQFVRFGFCRYDRNEGDKMVFWFLHK